MKLRFRKFLIFSLALFLFILPLVSVHAVPEKLIILHTNDIHGGINKSEAWWMNPAFPPPLGGAATAVTVIKEVRARAEEQGYAVLVMDCGDIWQGTPVGDKSQGKGVVKFFEIAGYDVRTLGNHDFDAGWQVAKSVTEASDIPVVCCNMIDKRTGEIPDWKNLSHYVVINKGGLKIGVVGGNTDDMETLLPPQRLEHIGFQKIGIQLPKYVKKLREEEKVDIVVALLHTGISYSAEERYKRLMQWDKEATAQGLEWNTEAYTNFMYEKKGYGLQDHEIAFLVPGIDILVGGHSHSGLYPPWEDARNHTIVVQAYSKLSSIGKLDIEIDPESRLITGYSAENFTLLSDEIQADKETEEIISKLVNEAEAGMKVPIGSTKKSISRGNDETLLGNLITDAIKEKFEVDVVLFNRGGMRSDISEGDITEMDVYQVLPFGNTVVTMEISGHMLKEILEVGFSGRRRDTQLTGVEVVVNPTFPEGNRICELKVNGQSLDLDKTYKFATSDYLARGSVGYYMFPGIEGIDYTGITVRDTLLEYVKKNSPLDPKLEGRIRRNEEAQYSEEVKQLNQQIKNRELELKDTDKDMEYR